MKEFTVIVLGVIALVGWYSIINKMIRKPSKEICLSTGVICEHIKKGKVTRINVK